MRPITTFLLCLTFHFATAQSVIIDTISLGCPDDQLLVLPANQNRIEADLFAPNENTCPPDSLHYELSGATEASGAGWAGLQNLNRGVTGVTYTGCEQASLSIFLGDPAFLPDGLGEVYTLPLNVAGFDDGASVTDAGGLVSICAELEHSYVGDLDIWLTCPDSSRLFLLFFEFGGNLSRQLLGQGSQFTSTPDPTDWYCWTLTAEQTLREYVVSEGIGADETIPPGDYLAAGDTTALADCPVNGLWSLNILDNLANDNGHVNSWVLTFGDASVKTCSYNVTVELAICESTVFGPTTNDTICTGETFRWNDVLYGESGNYVDTITNAFGCDSVSRLNLTVRPEDCPYELGELTGTVFRIDANGMPQPLPHTRLSAGFARDTAAEDGTYRLTGLSVNTDYTIEPSLNVDHANGISIIDVLIMRGLILGGNVLPAPTLPYPYLAADVNGDCEIDVRDLVGLLRVYTGRTDRFPGVDSYRFLPADYEFPELTANCGVPEAIELSLVDATFGANDFIGVKTGDLNLSAGTPDPEGIVPFGFPDREFRAGERVEVTLEPAEGLVAADLFWRFDTHLLQPATDNAFTQTNGAEMHQVWTDLAGPPMLSFTARANGSLADALWLTQDSRGVDGAAHVFALERITTEENDLRLTAYPNPFQNDFSIVVMSSEPGLAELLAFDMAGREVLRRPFTVAEGTEKIWIAATDWPAGVYQVVVVAGGERKNVRVVRF